MTNRKKKKKNFLLLRFFLSMQSFQLVNRIAVNERKTIERKKNRFNREKKSKELRRMDETVIFTVQWYTQSCPREHILKVNWKRTNELRHGAAAA